MCFQIITYLGIRKFDSLVLDKTRLEYYFKITKSLFDI